MNTSCSANGQKQTATLNCEISTMWKTKPRTTPQKASRLLMGLEQFTMPKPCKLYDDDDDDDDDDDKMMIMMTTTTSQHTVLRPRSFWGGFHLTI